MGKPKKITFVINNLSGGGAERILVNVLNNIDQTVIEPTLFLFEKQGGYLKDLNENIPVKYACAPQKESKGVAGKIKNFSLRCTVGICSLSKEIQNQDLVVAFLEKGVTYLTYEACRRANKPFYAWLHNNIEDSFSITHKILSKIAYENAEQILCVSNECEQIAIKQFPFLKNKIKTIYNPIDLEVIIEKSLDSCSFTLPKGKNIVAIGRLTEQKGFDILLKAFKNISNKYDGLNLIILGEGEQRLELEKLINEQKLQEKVYLPGFIDNPYAVLKQADIFVLSSRYEGLPTVLIEALTLNKQIVSTKCSGVSEILADGVYGKLVEINNVDSLANGIESILNSPIQVERYEHVRLFDKHKIMNQIESALIDHK